MSKLDTSNLCLTRTFKVWVFVIDGAETYYADDDRLSEASIVAEQAFRDALDPDRFVVASDKDKDFDLEHCPECGTVAFPK